MIDFPAWGPVPEDMRGATHRHNRLVASVGTTPDHRRALAQQVAERLADAHGPVCVLLPMRGIDEWDRPGQPMHDPEGLAALCDELTARVQAPTELQRLDCHINDAAFCEAALRVFDHWVSQGRIVSSQPHQHRDV